MTLQQAIVEARNGKFPSLGDSRKRYAVTLTEPEINAIHAASGFIKSAGAASEVGPFTAHYGPTLERLSERLGAFDD
jgi:hypothetical protein